MGLNPTHALRVRGLLPFCWSLPGPEDLDPLVQGPHAARIGTPGVNPDLPLPLSPLPTLMDKPSVTASSQQWGQLRSTPTLQDSSCSAVCSQMPAPHRLSFLAHTFSHWQGKCPAPPSSQVAGTSANGPVLTCGPGGTRWDPAKGLLKALSHQEPHACCGVGFWEEAGGPR